MANKYDKLDKAVEYDHEAAEQLAEALNEINELRAKIADLNALVDENPELHQFVWRTQENKVIAVHNLEDEHLANILRYVVRNGNGINQGLRAEARKRGILIPTVPQGVDPRYYLAEGEDF